MTLADLRRELVAITLHPLSPTNILELREDAGSVLVETDQIELEMSLEDAKTECQNYVEENKTLREELTAAEKERDELREIADGIKEGDVGIVEFKARAERAEETLRLQRKTYDDAQRELTALRKKKGTTAGYYKHAHEVMQFLYDCEKFDLTEIRRRREIILKAIHNPK